MLNEVDDGRDPGIRCEARAPIPAPSAARSRQGVVEAPPPRDVPGTPRIAIAVVHQCEILREGLSMLLAQQLDMRVVASCGSDTSSLRARLTATYPDVVLLHFAPQPADRAAQAAAVKDAVPVARLVVFGLPSAPSDRSAHMPPEVHGFVLDDDGPAELLRMVRSVAVGTRWWPPALAQKPLSRASAEGTSSGPATKGGAVRMTSRELEVIAEIADGLSTKEIARRLGIASFTVRAHVRNIMGKLDIHTRLQIAAHVHRERAVQEDVGGGWRSESLVRTRPTTLTRKP